MKKGVTLAGLFGGLALAGFIAGISSSSTATAYTVPTLVASVQASTASGTTLTCPAFAITPRQGDRIEAWLGVAASAPTVSSFPSGYTAQTGLPSSSTASLLMYAKTAGASEPNTGLQFVLTSAQNWVLECVVWEGVGSPTVEASIGTGSASGVSAFTTTSVNVQEPGTVPEEIVFDNSSSVTGVTDTNFSMANWSVIQGNLDMFGLQFSKPFNNAWWQSPVAGNPVLNAVGNAVAATVILRPIQQPFNVAQATVAPATAVPGSTPTPTPTPIATATPIAHILTQANYGTPANVNLNTNQVDTDKWINHCFSAIQNISPNCDGNPARNLFYYSAVSEPDGTGKDTSNPYRYAEAGTGCPEPTSGTIWKAIDGQVSWPTATKLTEASVLHYQGAASAVAATRIVAFYSHQYTGTQSVVMMIPMNLGTTEIQTYAQAVVQHCTQNITYNGTGQTYGYDNADAFFDNSGIGLVEGVWGMGDTYGYTQQKNINNSTGVPSTPAPIYASLDLTKCTTRTTLWGTTATSFCTSPSLASAVNSESTKEITTDAALCNNFNSFENNVKHANGQSLAIEFNEGGLIPGQYCQMAGSNAIGYMVEKQIVSGGAFSASSGNTTYNYYITNPIDFCAGLALAYPTKACVLEDTIPGTGTYAVGNAAYDKAVRQHYAVFWLIYSPAMIDHPYFATAFNGLSTCGANSATLCNMVDVQPADWLIPTAPVQTATQPLGSAGQTICSQYLTTKCTQGGHFSLTVLGSGNAVVMRREFQHCQYNPSFLNTNVGQVDKGWCSVVLNISGSAQPFQTSWLPNWSHYGHMISFCQHSESPLNYEGAVCETQPGGGSTAGDVGSALADEGTGPGLLNFTSFPSSYAVGASMPNNTAWFFIQ